MWGEVRGTDRGKEGLSQWGEGGVKVRGRGFKLGRTGKQKERRAGLAGGEQGACAKWIRRLKRGPQKGAEIRERRVSGSVETFQASAGGN